MTTETNTDGALAAALAKAQGEFPAITRDKEVTVQTKTGGSYKFKYAPLDSILAAVRKPLAENGLAITQLLDAGDLVTMLLHKDGASLSGRCPLPHIEGNVQAFGSAITYLRRYSIQAILGIAAEEDDDGNQAAGNIATFNKQDGPDPASIQETERGPVETMLGRVKRRGIIRKGSAEGYKLDARQGPDGHVIGFRLEIDGIEKNIPQCLVMGPLGEALYLATAMKPEALIGKIASVTGLLYNVKGDKASWYRLHVDRIETDDWILPADPTEPPEDLRLLGEKVPS